jgi:hypothetical protein
MAKACRNNGYQVSGTGCQVVASPVRTGCDPSYIEHNRADPGREVFAEVWGGQDI